MSNISQDKVEDIAVILTYHTLIDRDPKYIHGGWPATVLACMGIIVLCGLLSVIAVQKQFEAFEGNCIYTSNISFILRNDSSKTLDPFVTTLKPEENPESDASVGNTSTETTTKATAPGRKRRAKKIQHIFRSFETEYVAEKEEDYEDEQEYENKVKIELDRSKVHKKDDYDFLTSMQVDTTKTVWAQLSFCEYILYYPILSSIAGMVCITMLILFNAAGKASFEWGVPKPWRIVFPAVISFSIMSIASAVHLVLMKDAVKDLCKGLSEGLEQKDIQCDILIESLHPIANTDYISTGAYFVIHNVTMKITFAAWLIALIIMVLRMFFVIDFRLVRVTVSPVSPQVKKVQPSDISSSDSTELEQKAEQLDAGTSTKFLDPNKRERSGSSRDDMDDFQSAYSDPDRTVKEDSTSLEPLIIVKKTD